MNCCVWPEVAGAGKLGIEIPLVQKLAAVNAEELILM